MAHRGITLGSAVHRALELLDLAAPTEHAINLAVAAACSETGLPQLAGEMRPLVQSALRAPTVQLAATCRHWKEMPIIADIDGRTVEGIIDLLIETPHGMVVLDYKTDTVRSAAERAAKAAAYAPQITAYAIAIAHTGRHVHQAMLCFIAKNAVVEVPVPATAANAR